MIGFNSKCNYQFIETFGLKKGLKRFGKNGYDAAMKEMQQLHERMVFKPINISELTQQEKKRAMESLIFLVQKNDGRIKARTCANGSTQRSYINKEEATSPTALTEAIIITAAIEADEEVPDEHDNSFEQQDIDDYVGESLDEEYDDESFSDESESTEQTIDPSFSEEIIKKSEKTLKFLEKPSIKAFKGDNVDQKV